jgi:hypothetical protein
MNSDGVSQLIGDDDDYSIAWLRALSCSWITRYWSALAERDKWQAMLDRKFAKHQAQENRK